jgi:hypothetical protein
VWGKYAYIAAGVGPAGGKHKYRFAEIQFPGDRLHRCGRQSFTLEAFTLRKNGQLVTAERAVGEYIGKDKI